ncbi:MAG: diguanylate cyclase [Candidatus Cloacimonetes bacterium]|nr:diguanylate cyclase [Candidatus Cloacimonadota bacterium]
MKKVNISLIILFFVIGLHSYSKIDSLESKLKNSVAEEKIKILNELSRSYWYILPEKSVEYGKIAYLNAIEFNDVNQEDIAYKNIATAYTILKNYDQSIIYWLKSLECNNRTGKVEEIIIDLENIAGIYKHWKKHNKALEYYDKILKIHELKKDKKGIAQTFRSIGNIYKDMGNNEKAVKYHVKALKFEEDNIKVMIRDDYLRYSEIYAEMGKDEKALEYYKLYTTIRDTLIKEESSQKIAVMQQRYENEKERKQIEMLKKDKEISELEKEKQENIYEASIRKNQIEMLNKDKVLREFQLRSEKDRIQKKIDEIKKDKAIKELELSKKEILISKQKIIQKYYMIIIILFVIFAVVSVNQYLIVRKVNKQLNKSNKDLNETYRELELVAKTDPLTKLSNRRDIIEKIENEKKRFGRNGKHFVLIMADIDNFKSVNDRFGHDGGDFILESISTLMISLVRQQDVVGRWGGEEFLLLLPETELEGGRALAEKIRKNISITPYIFNDKKIPITVTFGVSVYNKPMDIDLCIKYSDEAMYKGKRRGKNCVVTSKQDDKSPIIGIEQNNFLSG